MRRVLLGVVVLAGALRVFEAARQYDRFLPQTEPEEGYWEIGEALRSHGALGAGIPNVEPQRWRGPLFPALGALLPGEPAPGKLRAAQAVLGAAGAALAFGLASTLAGPAAAGLAGLAVALEPAGVHGSLNIHVFYGLVLLALAAAAVAWKDRPFLLGLAVGASFMVRSAHWPLPLLLAALRPRQAGWLLLGAALAMAPRPFPDARAGAVALFAATLEGPVRNWPVEEAAARAEELEPGFRAAHPEGEVHDGLLRLARRRILAEPGRFAARTLERLAGFWLPLLPFLALALWSRQWTALAVLLSLSGYALAGGGAEHRQAAWPLLLTLAACALRGKPAPVRWLPAGAAVLAVLYAGWLWPRKPDEARYQAAVRRLGAGYRDTDLGRRVAAQALAGSAYRLREDCARAVPLLREALTLHAAAAGAVLSVGCPDAELERRAEKRLRGSALAQLLLRRGRDKEALAALRADPSPQARDMLDALSGRPAACLSELPLDRAKLPLSYYDGCLKKHPEAAALWKDRGVARFLKGDRKGAEADLARAVELSPGDEQARMSLDVVRQTRGR